MRYELEYPHRKTQGLPDGFQPQRNLEFVELFLSPWRTRRDKCRICARMSNCLVIAMSNRIVPDTCFVFVLAMSDYLVIAMSNRTPIVLCDLVRSFVWCIIAVSNRIVICA